MLNTHSTNEQAWQALVNSCGTRFINSRGKEIYFVQINEHKLEVNLSSNRAWPCTKKNVFKCMDMIREQRHKNNKIYRSIQAGANVVLALRKLGIVYG